MNPLNVEVAHVLVALAQVVPGVLVLVIARLAKGVLSPYRMDVEMTAKDNPAFGLAIAGYYLAAVAIYIGAASSAPLPLDAGTGGLIRTLAANLGWAIGGMVALAFSRWVMDAALVSGARCSDEIVRNHNLAAGAVECGVYVASGIVLAGALREPGGSLLTVLVFFLLSQIALLLFGRLYQAWAGYGIAREIRIGNLAAGAAFGLTLIALSLLMLKATSGEFIDWSTNLAFFAFDAVIGFGLLMLLRWVTDLALLPNARIVNEIVQDRNTNVGLLEGVIAVAVALLILFVF